MKKVREAAQAYVILSRVQTIDQLFLIGDAYTEKIYASTIALDELNRMMEVALNLQHIAVDTIMSCNIRCLKKNIVSFSKASLVSRAVLICLQETWSQKSDPVLSLFGNKFTNQHSNSMGKGKGITTLYDQSYDLEKDVAKPLYQMTKIASKYLDVINVYRSQGANTKNFENDLLELVYLDRHTIILGDFNLCYQKYPNHSIFQMLRDLGFQQQVKFPTHMEGGTIDLVFTLNDKNIYKHEIQQTSQHYTDHDLITIRYLKLIYNIV